MKENHQIIVQAVEYAFQECKRLRKVFTAILFVTLCISLNAQCKLNEAVFKQGEEIEMNVYFHWGLLMPKAGSAVLSMDDDFLNGEKTFRQRLIFKTTPFFDKVYSMRDTVDTHYDKDYTPLYYLKKADEDDYFLWDEMKFHTENGITTVPTKRWDKNRTKIDTTHVVDGCLFDVLSVATFLRGLDKQSMTIGSEVPTNFIMGRDVIKVKYRYAGQEIIERGDKLYRTKKFYMDVYDNAVTQNKGALEIWLSDDKNQIPIKIRAKLKIGAAEAYFIQAKGLQYPFTSEIQIPRS